MENVRSGRSKNNWKTRGYGQSRKKELAERTVLYILLTRGKTRQEDLLKLPAKKSVPSEVVRVQESEGR